jgi:signal transduction histidine kinase
VVWLANAVFLSALLVTPKAQWWVVLATTAVTHIAAMNDVAPAWRWSWQIVGNSVFAITTVALIRRFAGHPLLFESRRQVLAYTALAFVMPALFAPFMPAFVRAVLHLETTYTPAVSWLRILLSNATALLVVAPALVVWGQGGWQRLRALPPRRFSEAAAIMFVVLGVGVVAFASGPEFARYPSVLVWIFPPLLWAAVRFGPGAAATALFCIAALSLLGTATQLGPFVLVTQADRVLSLQLFWIVLYLPVMLLAASIREREQAETALQEQRRQLAHVTRVATVGELSGAVAHEVRQPLTSILANARAGMRLLGTGSLNVQEFREILEDIVHDSHHAETVIGNLRSFLRNGASHSQPVALDTVVRDALGLAHGTMVIAGIDVQMEVAPGLPPVQGDPVQLLQVVLNLVMNSCESLCEVPAAERQLRLRLTPGTKGHVELQITDTGVGLPSGEEDEVFKPFFTTKETGLGLGLAIARTIVIAHQGRMWGQNNPGGGATFHVELPVNGARVVSTSHSTAVH